MRSLILITIVVSLLHSSSVFAQKETPGSASRDKLLMAVAWYQNSPEMMALYYQGFNMARLRLDEAVAGHTSGKPLAVVVDIDETMLDNSPFEATLIDKGDFQKGWYDWTTKAKAKALPGALEFVMYAKSKNVETYYITNRDSLERKVTLQNLKNEGFPFATEDHLLTRDNLNYTTGNTSSKEGRRSRVAENHEIILLIGDNLNDFSVAFENRHSDYGKQAVRNNREEFGRKFIVLPNPMYGAWEKPLTDFKEGLTEDQKSELIRSKLRKE